MFFLRKPKKHSILNFGHSKVIALQIIGHRAQFNIKLDPEWIPSGSRVDPEFSKNIFLNYDLSDV